MKLKRHEVLREAYLCELFRLPDRARSDALAVALFGALVASPETFLRGMRASLVLAALLLLATTAASLLLASPHSGQCVGTVWQQAPKCNL